MSDLRFPHPGRTDGAEHGELRPARGADHPGRFANSTGAGLDTLPTLDHSPRREQMPGMEMEQPGQAERDRQRQQERERQRGLDGPDIGQGR